MDWRVETLFIGSKAKCLTFFFQTSKINLYCVIWCWHLLANVHSFIYHILWIYGQFPLDIFFLWIHTRDCCDYRRGKCLTFFFSNFKDQFILCYMMPTFIGKCSFLYYIVGTKISLHLFEYILQAIKSHKLNQNTRNKRIILFF